MGHTEYMRALLEPLGAYDLDGTYNGAELSAVGDALDDVMVLVNDLEREMSLCTAQDWGLDQVAELLSVTPVTENNSGLADAYARLLRVGGDSSTLSRINDTVRGCGVYALVTELGAPNQVKVSFPEVVGVPEGYDKIKPIIDSILPAQVLVEYFFWYRTWQMIENLGYTWQTAGLEPCWGHFISGDEVIEA